MVAEALAYGKPVITTKGAPWQEIATRNAGFWIDIGVKPLVSALNEALTLSESELNDLGRNGQKLIQDKYSIEAVSSSMIKLYEWIITRIDRPEFILL